MRVFNYSTGADTAGQAVRFKQAFDRLADKSEWQYDSLAVSTNYIAYPEDHAGSVHSRVQAAARLYRDADVVHLNNSLDGWQYQDQINGPRLCRPVVIHHHGTTFRDKPHETAAGCRAIGAVQIASTLDLTLPEPDVEWVPAPYDLAWLASLSAGYEPSERVTVVHAPTNRNVKRTPFVIAAVERLQAKGLPFDFALIEQQPWADTLRQVSQADIVLDQFWLGYGCLAVESWGMGKVVVGGVEDPSVRRAMVQTWGRVPFVEATAETLAKVLERLVKSRQAREEAAAIGGQHVARYHDDAKVIARMQEIYRDAPPTRYPVSSWRGVKPWRKSA